MVLRQIATIATYIVLEALYTRFFIVIAIFLAVGFGLTLFLGQIALTEGDAMKSSLLAAFLRLSAMYINSLFVISSTVREFNERSIYLTLSLPLQRSTYFLGKIGGFAMVAFMTSLLFGSILLGYSPPSQVLLWSGSLLCELLIINTASLLFTLTFTHVVQAFSAVLGFYLLARSIGTIQLMTQGILLHNSQLWFDHFIREFVNLLATVLPNLDHFTRSEWLVYHTGQFQDLVTIGVQTVIYVAFLSAMGLFDLYRKNL